MSIYHIVAHLAFSQAVGINEPVPEEPAEAGAGEAATAKPKVTCDDDVCTRN